MSLSDIETGAASALRELLNFREPIAVVAEVEGGDSGGDPAESLRSEGPMLICSLARAEEAIRAMPFKVPTGERHANGEWRETGGGQHLVDIEPHRSRSNLCWALTAAVAVAIARASCSEIEDWAAFFTPACDGIDPEAFVKSLAVAGIYDDLRAAAETFHVGMHKSPEVAQWVRDGCPQRCE
jgi:hypothetical protein